jgi:hypothetical protein
LVIGLLLVSVPLASCGDSSSSAGPTVPIGHVHALGVDPADGTLMAAAHGGLFEVVDGRFRRVGTSSRDLMGLVVIAPNDYLGSGHPDVAGMRAGEPGLQGLIRSTDGGLSWSEASMGSQADFHQIVVTDEGILAWDSTSNRLLASADREHWDTRSTIDAQGIAVDRSDGRVVAATPLGLSVSLDGGRTWQTPSDVIAESVTWSSALGLAAVDRAGAVWVEDGSGSWVRRGSLPAPPTALIASDGDLYAAIEQDGSIAVLRSEDGGRDWERIAAG